MCLLVQVCPADLEYWVSKMHLYSNYENRLLIFCEWGNPYWQNKIFFVTNTFVRYSAGCEKLFSLFLFRAIRLFQSSPQRTKRPRSRPDLVESPKRIQMKTTITNLHRRTVYKRLNSHCMFYQTILSCILLQFENLLKWLNRVLYKKKVNLSLFTIKFYLPL